MTPGKLEPSNREDPMRGGSTGSNGSNGSQEHAADDRPQDTEQDGETQRDAFDVEPAPARTVAAIPAYNEALTIGSIVHQASRYVDQVVVVDDGSTDATVEIARQAGARVLRHRENQGKGQAIRTLFDWAKKTGVEEMVLLDGDGQHDPDQIPDLLEPIQTGEADVSLGFRFGENTEMPFYRRIGKRVLDYATAIGTDGEVTDSQCGYRAFNRTAIETLKLKEKGFAVEGEMLMEARKADLSFTEVPITCRYEEVDGSTEDPVTHGFGVLDRTIHLVTERRPLLFMGVPALVTVLFGVSLGTWVIWTLKMTGQFAVGTALLTSLFVLGGVFVGLTAILLHVIPKTLERHLDPAKTAGVDELEPDAPAGTGATAANGKEPHRTGPATVAPELDETEQGGDQETDPLEA